MSREILFKAKRKNWRDLLKEEWWVEGDLRQDGDLETAFISGWNYYISENGPEREPFEYEIDPETLCQYIGKADRNGQKIWENAIIKHERSDTIGTVKWYQGDYLGWCVDDVYIGEQQCTDEMWDECEVIGNEFDDAGLLE